jgi:hypothetical protein
MKWDVSILWVAATAVVSFAVSWGTNQRARNETDRRLIELESFRNAQHLSALAIAQALGNLESIATRLERIESIMISIPKRHGDTI